MGLLPILIFGYEGDYGTESIFTTGAGARADAMAGAFTSVADDISSILYNPAGLSLLQRIEVSLLYYPIYENSFYGFAGLGYPFLDFGVFGIGVFNFSSKSIQGYDLYDKKTDVYKVDEYKISIAYAKEIDKRVYSGISLNIFTSNIAGYLTNGVGMDAGILYKPFVFLNLGLVIQNLIKPSLYMNTLRESIPQRYILGMALNHDFNICKAIATFDFLFGEDENFKYKLGIEIKWFDALSIRAGYDDGLFCIGGGISLYLLSLDYAFVSNKYLNPFHKFSFNYKFGATLKEQKIERRKILLKEIEKQVNERFKQKIKEKSMEYYKRAYQFYERGDFETALSEVERSLEWDPKNVNSIKMKNFIENKLKINFYKETKKDIKDEKNPYVLSGLNFYIRKNYEKAIKDWEQALKLEPDNTTIKLYLEKAREKILIDDKKTKVRQIKKEELDKLYYDAINLYTEGRIEEAIMLWKKVLLFDPEDIRSLRNLEKAQLELDELKKRGVK